MKLKRNYMSWEESENDEYILTMSRDEWLKLWNTIDLARFGMKSESDELYQAITNAEHNSENNFQGEEF